MLRNWSFEIPVKEVTQSSADRILPQTCPADVLCACLLVRTCLCVCGGIKLGGYKRGVSGPLCKLKCRRDAVGRDVHRRVLSCNTSCICLGFLVLHLSEPFPIACYCFCSLADTCFRAGKGRGGEGWRCPAGCLCGQADLYPIRSVVLFHAWFLWLRLG